MKRIIPGVLLALGWLILLLKGNFLVFGVVVLIIAFIGSHEYLRMSFKDECTARSSYLLSGLFSLPVFAALCSPGHSSTGTLFVTFALLSFYTLYKFRDLDNSFLFLCRLCFGLMYVGFLASHLVLLRGLSHGDAWLVILVAITAGSDTGAYFSGRRFGKHKLCPNISPNKTIEGAVGGLVAAIVTSTLLAHFLLPDIHVFLVIALAIPLTAAGILGDLLESVIKRGTSTKDSGTLLRGHGGVLDRVDSMLLAGPVLYYLLILFGLK